MIQTFILLLMFSFQISDETLSLLPFVANGDEKGKEEDLSKIDLWSKLRSHVFTPRQLVHQLRTSPSKKLYCTLRKHLKDSHWTIKFVKESGVEVLLDTLKTLQGKNFEEVQLKVECGRCLRMVMDSRVGLDYIMESDDYAQKLATGKLIIEVYSLKVNSSQERKRLVLKRIMIRAVLKSLYFFRAYNDPLVV